MMAESQDGPAAAATQNPTAVFVDGFNFFSRMRECFDGQQPTEHKFWLPGLVRMMCDRTSYPVPLNKDIHFVIGRLSENTISRKSHEFWENKIREMRDAGVTVHLGPKVSRETQFACPKCKRSVASVCPHCTNDLHEEKPTQRGVSTLLALTAVEAALMGSSTHFLLFAQNRDYLPLVQALRVNVKARTGQAARIATVFPTCQKETHVASNIHSKLEATLGVDFTHAEFQQSLSIEKPPRRHRGRTR